MADTTDIIARSTALKGSSFVAVVDEDQSVHCAVMGMLCAAGHTVNTFACVGDLLARARVDIAGCVLIGSCNLDLLRQLVGAPDFPSIIWMTDAGGDIAMAVSAMKAGAVDVLTKPLVSHKVVASVDGALAQYRLRCVSRAGAAAIIKRAATLTARELQVMALVTAGLMNKQVAGELKLSEISVKIHRGNLMKKMGARSLPELVRAADLLSLYA